MAAISPSISPISSTKAAASARMDAVSTTPRIAPAKLPRSMKVEVEIQDSPSSQPFTFGGRKRSWPSDVAASARTAPGSGWSRRIAIPAR